MNKNKKVRVNTKKNPPKYRKKKKKKNSAPSFRVLTEYSAVREMPIALMGVKPTELPVPLQAFLDSWMLHT